MTRTIERVPDGTTYEERYEPETELPSGGTTCLEVGEYGSLVSGNRELLWPRQRTLHRLISGPCELLVQSMCQSSPVRMAWTPTASVFLSDPQATVFSIVEKLHESEEGRAVTSYIASTPADQTSEGSSTLLGQFLVDSFADGLEGAADKEVDISMISLASSRPSHDLPGPEPGEDLPRRQLKISSDLFGEDD